MNFFLAIGQDSIAWSLRRLHCPVDENALVLEVGSGGNPYFRANVLIDAYIDAKERWETLTTDRPTVLGFVERLPFRDKAFDFVIASHVLEHSPDPEKFLSEIQRVAKAGYIEVPDAFMERVNPYPDHRSELTVRNGKLIIKKKPAAIVDSELEELYAHRAKQVITTDTIPKKPFHFHVRFYWKDKINYEIVNPEVDAAWPVKKAENKKPIISRRAQINAYILDYIRKFFSQNERNKKIVLENLLCCPSCKSPDLNFAEVITCSNCSKAYEKINDIPDFTKL